MLWKLDHLVTVRPDVGRNISRKTLGLSPAPRSGELVSSAPANSPLVDRPFWARSEGSECIGSSATLGQRFTSQGELNPAGRGRTSGHVREFM
jgi:hypothetical protein